MNKECTLKQKNPKAENFNDNEHVLCWLVTFLQMLLCKSGLLLHLGI